MGLLKQNPARGQRFAAARQAKKLTQVQVAARLGVDAATVSRWERGGIISEDHLATLCELLGLTIHQGALAD